MSVENKSCNFVEEYIVPQQLMKWILESSNYDGIFYRTCSANQIAGKWNYVNLVMPATQIKDEYSLKLNNVFTVSNPVFVKVSDKLEASQFKLDEIYETISLIT